MGGSADAGVPQTVSIGGGAESALSGFRRGGGGGCGGWGGLEEGLHLLVCLLRERTCCGLPARERIRHGLLHWLAFRVRP